MADGFVRINGEDLTLAVRLTPRSAKDMIGGSWRDDKGMDWLQVAVRAVPEKGRANAALIQFIARRLRIPAKDVLLESGDTSRLKRLRLVGHAMHKDEIVKEVGVS